MRSPARPGLLERAVELAALAELVEAAPGGGRPWRTARNRRAGVYGGSTAVSPLTRGTIQEL